MYVHWFQTTSTDLLVDLRKNYFLAANHKVNNVDVIIQLIHKYINMCQNRFKGLCSISYPDNKKCRYNEWPNSNITCVKPAAVTKNKYTSMCMNDSWTITQLLIDMIEIHLKISEINCFCIKECRKADQLALYIAISYIHSLNNICVIWSTECVA